MVDGITDGAGSNYVLSEPTETTMGGHLATQIEVALADGTAGEPRLFTLGEGGNWSLFAGNRGRLYVVDVDGKPVVVAVEAPDADFDAFSEEAEAVLQTVAF